MIIRDSRRVMGNKDNYQHITLIKRNDIANITRTDISRKNSYEKHKRCNQSGNGGNNSSQHKGLHNGKVHNGDKAISEKNGHGNHRSSRHATENHKERRDKGSISTSNTDRIGGPNSEKRGPEKHRSRRSMSIRDYGDGDVNGYEKSYDDEAHNANRASSDVKRIRLRLRLREMKKTE